MLVPGPPDAPDIWTRFVGKDEFVIEWGEPRLWGVKVEGYQVNLLSSIIMIQVECYEYNG